MRKTEIEAAGDLAGEALATVGTLVRDMHQGIAGRPFAALGVAAAPVRVVHDGIARTVYGGVRGALRGSARAAAGAIPAREDWPGLAEGTYGALAVAALNGVWGNHLVARRSALAADLRVIAGAPATPRLAVFVHGLCETEAAWRLGGRRTYGDRLRDELGYTPVYARYNTGLHISENGRALAQALDELLAEWPEEVEEIVLVGHSMGGLVARSACHYGGRFTDAVSHVFCLGTPHLGADLEKGANVLAWALGRLPETRPFGAVLNARSAGIKDLRYGSCVEDDWCDCDPDEFLRDRCGEVPFLPDAHYYFIGAQLNPAVVGTLVGDLLVRMPSASGRGSGRGRRIPFEIDHGHELPGLTHFHLLNHPAVYAQLRSWLGQRAAATTTAATPASPRAFG
jgi:pimeloyl-ACP methyl ester carboxylesterase